MSFIENCVIEIIKNCPNIRTVVLLYGGSRTPWGWGQRFPTSSVTGTDRLRWINFSSSVSKNIKSPLSRTFFILHGGGTEIRTLGTLRHGSFQDCCIKPLCHPSVGCEAEYRRESLFVKIFFENPIANFFSAISIMKLEHILRNNNSFWLSQFLIGSHGTRKEEEANQFIKCYVYWACFLFCHSVRNPFQIHL